RFERLELPFAPISRPHDLFDDPHLQATGGLAEIRMNDGSLAQTPLLPFTLGGERAGVRLQPPGIGEHSARLLAEVGYSPAEIEAMVESGAVVAPAAPD
ncbi:MAG: CoA transferase, partial [Comamonadaceae bacterium]